MDQQADDQRTREATGEVNDAQFAAALRTALVTATAADLLATTSPPDLLLDRLVRTAAQAIPSPEGALFLVDTERRVLTFAVVIGATAAAVKELTVPLGHGIAGLVAVSRQPIAVANAQEDPRHARDIAALSDYFPTTILAVPVVTPDGAALGVLELLDRQGQPTYSLDDMHLLAAFAEQAALALEQRRAHASVAALVGRALAALGGLPPQVEQTITAQADAFATAVEADPAARRTMELAELITAITASNPAAHEACIGILASFAGYLRAVPAPGTGLESLR